MTLKHVQVRDPLPRPPIQSSSQDPFHARYWEGYHKGRKECLAALAKALTTSVLGVELVSAIEKVWDEEEGLCPDCGAGLPDCNCVRYEKRPDTQTCPHDGWDLETARCPDCNEVVIPF